METDHLIAYFCRRSSAAGVAPASRCRPKLRGACSESRGPEDPPRIQPSDSGCQQIAEAVSAGNTVRTENRAAGPADCPNFASHHQVSTSSVLSGMTRSYRSPRQPIAHFLLGLSRRRHHLSPGRRRRGCIPCHGDSLDKPFGRVHAGDDGAHTTKAHVPLSDHLQRECQLVRVFTAVRQTSPVL